MGNISEATVGFVAGTGIDLTPLLDHIDAEIPFPAVRGARRLMEGHQGRFLFGTACGQPVVLQCGRRHLYEGIPLHEVVQTVSMMREYGAKTVVFTNAAGGLVLQLEPGSLVAIDRVVVWPCNRWPARPSELRADFVLQGCDAIGTYVWMHGPSYETRAEIGALRGLGATVVGMSTAPEMAECQALGIRTAAVSCVTNNCCRPAVLTHERVVETARRASSRLAALLRKALPQLIEFGPPLSENT
jgi:purine-nucleoside phosphorylase